MELVAGTLPLSTRVFPLEHLIRRSIVSLLFSPSPLFHTLRTMRGAGFESWMIKVAQMVVQSESTATIRTRKFLTNRLLARRQMVRSLSLVPRWSHEDVGEGCGLR